MGLREDYDFSGWATKNDLLCDDGRTIRSGAFKGQNGEVVPLVWNHGARKDPTNILGHALLENREDGVYTYCKFNNSPKASHVKEAVKNGDLGSLSIYANHLVQKDNGRGLRDVLHGSIREVSLVLTGANPGATIDTVLAHSGDMVDGYELEFEEDSGIISTNEPLELSHSIYDPEEGEHMDEELMHAAEEKSIEDIVDTMNDEQLDALCYLLGVAGTDEDLEHSADEDYEDEYEDSDYDNDEYEEDEYDDDEYYEEDDEVKYNTFEGDYVEHSGIEVDFDLLNADAQRLGSLREAVLQHAESYGVSDDELCHAGTYGIDNIDYLFPDYKSLNTPPEFISRNMDWVQGVLDSVHHTPFSRIKSMFADITEDDARARGYIKGNLKKEEVFTLLKRTTDPQTIYKKQKIDRDDVIDITDFDVIAWIKAEMRMMLDEEIARAILVGDGRLPSSDDKIKQEHVRAIYLDDDFYSIKVPVKVSANATDEEIAKAMINAAIKSRKDYKGSGNLTLYTTADVVTDGLLLEDGIGHKLYKTEQELATAMRMSKIVEVEVMENQTREGADHKTRPLLGIAVNLKDYNVGADKGGAVSMFDDFDIDYNQMKYLIETRISGALIKPKSAIVFELDKAAAAGGGGN